jgi:hypothetical protein
MIIKVDLTGIVARGTFDIKDKMEECSYFLGMMRKTSNWSEFRWLTSAFLNAARSALDWIAYMIHYDKIDEDGNTFIDKKALERLSKYITVKAETKSGKVYASPRHELLIKLCKHRLISAHQGPLIIKPERVSKPSEFYFKEGSTQVINFSENVLSLLFKIQRDIRG